MTRHAEYNARTRDSRRISRSARDSLLCSRRRAEPSRATRCSRETLFYRRGAISDAGDRGARRVRLRYGGGRGILRSAICVTHRRYTPPWPCRYPLARGWRDLVRERLSLSFLLSRDSLFPVLLPEIAANRRPARVRGFLSRSCSPAATFSPPIR
jgi:hypothetical protein